MSVLSGCGLRKTQVQTRFGRFRNPMDLAGPFRGRGFGVVLAGLIAFGFGGGIAFANTCLWTGATNSNFATTTNWSGCAGVAPQPADDVSVDGTVTLNANTGATITVKSLTIKSTYTKSVSQNSSTPIHLTGSFSIAGGTFAASSSSTVQVDGTMTASGGTFTSNGSTVTATGGLTVSGGAFSGNSSTLTVGSLTVSSGTFTGGSAQVLIGGTLSLTGGTFTATSNTTQIGGAFSRTSGNTFDANGGTMLFSATTAQSHTFSGATMADVIINDSLVGYWTFDDKKITDSSGYGNTGTKNGTTSFVASVPGTIGFDDPWSFTPDGATGYAQVAAPVAMPAANAAQTISLWAQFASSSTTQAIVALTGAGSAVEVGLGSGHVRVWKSGGTDLANVNAPGDGAWHHIAYTTDGTTDKLYLDGNPTNGLGVMHNAGAPTNVFIGADSSSTNFFNGSVDEVRVYNRALNAREIASMASGLMPGTGIATHTFSDAFTSGNADDFVIASGTVAGSSAIAVGGNWFNYGGRFTNTTTVALTGGGGRSLLSGGQSFTNLNMSGSGTYTLADRLWVPGGTVTISATGNINGGAYVAHIGTLSDPSNQWARGTGTVVLDGSSDQTLTSKSFYGLRIEDPTEAGIVGYWKLDAGQGTSLLDVSGNANTGSLSASGTIWTAAPPSTTVTFDDASAMKFDGATGYATLGTTNLPAASAAETISVWVKLGATSGTQDMVALGDGAGHGVKLGLNGGTLSAWTWGGTSLAVGATPVDGAWHNVVYSYDGTNNKIYVDGVAATSTVTAHQSATTSQAFLGTYDGTHELLNGSLDDVRIYNVALTAAQIAQLAKGRYAGTGGIATVTAGAAVTIPIGDWGFAIDSGNFSTAAFAFTVNVVTSPCIVNSGTLHVGSKVVNCDGGFTINPMATLLLDTSGGKLKPGDTSTVAIDGTLIASNTGALISRDASGDTFQFKVGTFSGSTPTLNITGLGILYTDANGMQINAAAGANTSIVHFDNVSFNHTPSGTGQQYLKITANSLYLSSNGCTFGVGESGSLPVDAVTLIGNGTGDGETRAVFGGTTCANSWANAGSDKTCVATVTPKSDDDADNNGVADSPGNGVNFGAVVQFARAADDDTSGSIEGFPTAAFDWNTFTYYSTYVAFHTAIGGADAVYVRDETGAPLYSWTVPSGETIIGTPKWNTVSSKHYLYVATTAGHVYRLVDNATGTTSGSLTLDASGAWATNPYNANGTITTPMTADASNLYWGGNPTAGGHGWWTVGQATESVPTGSPFPITPTITSAAPSIWTVGATSYLLLGVTGHVLKISLTSQAIVADNSSPGTASVWGRISAGTSHTGGTSRVYAGADNGTLWAIDPAAGFATSGGLWSYHTANAIMGSSYYDNLTDTVQYGTQGGTVIVLNGSGAVLNASYPYTPGAAGDAITAAPLYYGGVLVVGSTGGKLYFIDRNNGASTPAAALIREYYFGPSEAVSGISFDPTVNRYMVSTANPASKDGHLYYFDLIADPTPGSS